MKTRATFNFWAYGILTIAAFSMLLYVTTSLVGREDIGSPLLLIAVFIVVSFFVYMFVKLSMRRRYPF